MRWEERIKETGAGDCGIRKLREQVILEATGIERRDDRNRELAGEMQSCCKAVRGHGGKADLKGEELAW